MQIHFDAARGDWEGVCGGLKRGVAIDVERSPDGWTPLMCAAASRRAGADTLRFLVSHGADVNRVSSGRLQDTPLGLAAKHGGPEKVAVLLDSGARADFQNHDGYTALIHAVHSMHAQRAEVVRLLLAADTDPDAASAYGESAPRVASWFGRFDLVRILLDAGADPSPLAWTPLMHAAALGTPEDVSEELERGGDLSAREWHERTPFLVAALAGDPKSAELLLEAGADLDERARCGTTALMLAVQNDHAEMAAWLLRMGSDANATNEFDDTALLQASEWGAPRSVRVLLDAGADPCAQNHVESQAIALAGNAEIVQMLVAAGADLDYRDGQGYSALSRAAEDGDEKLVAALLEMGAPPDHPGLFEQALHRALNGDEAEVVQLLLWAGADPNRSDGDGWTPLMYAQTPGTARVLIAAGAVLSPDVEKWWRGMGKSELVEVLVTRRDRP